MSVPELVRIRVLIVDDHPIARRGVSCALGVFDDIQVIGEAASGEEAVRLYETLGPDVVLMDVNMPGMDGITATQRLAARHPDLRVLMLTHYAEPETIRTALRAGASGYLVKDVTLDELAQAVRTTYAGHTVLSKSATQALVQSAPSARDAGRAGTWPAARRGEPAKVPEFAVALSRREQQVLTLVAAGKSNEEIARELVISHSTARTHVSTIMSKLGASNRAEAAAVGQRYSLFGEAGERAGHAGASDAGPRAGTAASWLSAPGYTRAPLTVR